MTLHEQLAAGPLPCFIRPLRAAIRAGHKTETRRILHPQPTATIPPEFRRWRLVGNSLSLADRRDPDHVTQQEWSLTQSQIGAHYYLREPLKNVNGFAHYADDDALVYPALNPDLLREQQDERLSWHRVNGQPLQRNTLPQIHMPARAARTFVRLKNIWTEPLHALTEASAVAEGIRPVSPTGPVLYQPPGDFYSGNNEGLGPICGDARTAFQALWDAINAKRDGGQWAWKNNPFVIVRQFELIP